MKLSLSIILLIVLISSCSEEMSVPKPPTYLRLELPDHSYRDYKDDCPYILSIPSIYSISSVSDENGATCHKDIKLGPLNGIIHFSYIDMTDPLSKYVNFANDKVDEHKIKASAINDMKILREQDSVFCTFFELQGDVASPFQFYMTDSTSKFVSAVVYFNSAPNYDSLRPSLDYLKIDLEHLINTFKWKD